MPVGMNCIGIVWHIVASRVRTLWLVGKACSFGLPPTMPSKWSLGVIFRVPAFQRFKWEAKGKHAFCVGGGVHILRQAHGVLNRSKFEAGGLGIAQGYTSSRLARSNSANHGKPQDLSLNKQLFHRYDTRAVATAWPQRTCHNSEALWHHLPRRDNERIPSPLRGSPNCASGTSTSDRRADLPIQGQGRRAGLWAW